MNEKLLKEADWCEWADLHDSFVRDSLFAVKDSEDIFASNIAPGWAVIIGSNNTGTWSTSQAVTLPCRSMSSPVKQRALTPS